ncbi:MAG: lysylphosphatidylglycerol synthase transmembrane domain-containing protein [Candidatus Nealsonbacteria bacterium]
MKKLLLLSLSFAVGFAIFIWIWKTIGLEQIKKDFMVFTGWQGLVIFGLTLLSLAIGSWRWKVILNAGNIKVSFRDLFGAYLAGFSIIFLAPILIWGGEFTRAYILKNKKDISFTKAMASIVVDRILEWTINFLIIFFGSLFFLMTIGFPPINLIIIFGSAFLVLMTGLAIFYFKCTTRESILNFFIKNNKSKFLELEKEVFSFFKWKRFIVWQAVLISFLRAATMWVRVWFLIIFLGKIVGGLSALSILGFSYLAIMIPIPTALGTHEAIQVFAFNSLGLGASAATAFTMIIRGAELLVAIVGIVILFKLGLLLMKDAFFKRLEGLTDNDNL